MTHYEFEELLTMMLQDIWVDGHLDQIQTYFSPDVQVYGLVPGAALGRSDYRNIALQYGSLTKITSFEITDTMTQGNRASFRVQTNMTHLATGMSHSQQSAIFLAVDGGRIIELYNHSDFLSFFENVGSLPQQSAYYLLAGGTMA